MTQSRVFGRGSELTSGSKRDAPHDTLLVQGGVELSEDIHSRLYVGGGVFKRAGWAVADGWCDSLDLRSQTTSGAATQGVAGRTHPPQQATG